MQKHHDTLSYQGSTSRGCQSGLLLRVARPQSNFICQASIHLHIALAQVNLGQLNLLLQLGVSFGDVIECEDGKTQATEKVASKHDDGVEGKLYI